MYLRAVGRRFTQMNAYFLVMNSKRCSKQYHRKLLLSIFYLNWQNLGFSPQTFSICAQRRLLSRYICSIVANFRFFVGKQEANEITATWSYVSLKKEIYFV